jgi:methylmalonyl-CoA mutase cobalamin-binding subunit
MPMARRANGENGRLSIGALSRATGIPVETLRTWERRYAFPVPLRKPSGHRVYPLDAVPRLRRVAEALARGHRPAEVVPLSEAALGELLASIRTRPAVEPPARSMPRISPDTPTEMRELMDAVASFDGPALRRRLEGRWLALGPLDFLERVAAPFLVEIGEAWQKGTLGIRHEHFASARLGDFLREARRPFEERSQGPRAAFLTFPDDQHELGLLMASLVFALSGWRVLYLGPNTPVDQAGSLARDASLDAVAVSISPSYAKDRAGSEVRALRRHLPRAVPLVIGGTGAPEVALKGVTTFGGLAEAGAWAAERNA